MTGLPLRRHEEPTRGPSAAAFVTGQTIGVSGGLAVHGRGVRRLHEEGAIATIRRPPESEARVQLVPIDLDENLWSRVFVVSPVVLVGTREPDGSQDFAPKHRVVTLARHLGFVCRPTHATWRNALREKAFTVSWPKPRQIVMAAAAASPRCEDGEKRTLRALPSVAAKKVDGALVEGGSFHVECVLSRVLDEFGDEGLILGEVVAAHADPEALRAREVPDPDLVHDQPLIAYLHPNQFALVDRSWAFPFPKDFTRK